ncbi:MAG: hypothetical protein OTI34_11540 [Lewinella sp.]|nr:hypothetical protein [Lewinella sp.]
MLKKVLFLLAAACVVMSSCVDEERSPVITQDNLLFGAFPFLNELKTGEFDLADLTGSAYEMDIYFVDNAGGADIAQYNVYVAFDDNNPVPSDLSTERTLFKSFGPSDFAPLGDKGNLGMTLRIPFTEVAAFVGASNVGDVISGDRFQFSTEVIKEDGRVFASTNSTPAVTNAFGGLFDFNVNATCPLPDDVFAGDYNVQYGYVYDVFPLFGADVQPFGPALDATVTLGLVAGSTTRRSFNFGAYLLPGYGFGTSDVVLDFACDVVTSSAVDSGAGCGGGSIAAVQVNSASFDLADDSTWTIEYEGFGPNDGGCGVPELKPWSVVFTKQ